MSVRATIQWLLLVFALTALTSCIRPGTLRPNDIDLWPLAAVDNHEPVVDARRLMDVQALRGFVIDNISTTVLSDLYVHEDWVSLALRYRYGAGAYGDSVDWWFHLYVEADESKAVERFQKECESIAPPYSDFDLDHFLYKTEGVGMAQPPYRSWVSHLVASKTDNPFPFGPMGRWQSNIIFQKQNWLITIAEYSDTDERSATNAFLKHIASTMSSR